jgi:hypothetical protein
MKKAILVCLLALLIQPAAAKLFLSGSASDPASPLAPNLVTSANLKVWFEGDAGCLNGGSSACADGDAVATWQDQSGQGNHATQGGCTAKPVYNTNVFDNGKPALLFTAASSQCLVDSYAGAVGTIITVSYSNAPSGFSVIIAGKPQGGSSVTAYDIIADTPPVDTATYGNYHTRQFDFGTSSSTSTYSWYTNPQRMRNSWSISGMTQDGTTLKSYEQATLLASMTKPGGATVHTATGQVIGAGDYGGSIGSGPTYFNGYIAEIITYDGAISDADYARVVSWLQAKYDMAPSGQYLLFANNKAQGSYSDLNLYLQQGDGTNWRALPVNALQPKVAGQTDTSSLSFMPLTDDQGNLVKYNGLYWARNTRCGWPSPIVYPCVKTDILYSSDLVHWTVAALIDADALGITDGTSPNRVTFNDQFFIDRNNGNAVYAMLDASNDGSTAVTGFSEWVVPVTLNSNGTVTQGAAIHMSGSAFPGGGGSWYAEFIAYKAGTYYTFWTDQGNSGRLMWATSTTGPFTGYNTSGNYFPVTSCAVCEWPKWIQVNGSGTIYWDDSSGTTSQATASDGAFGTVSGITAGAALNFQKAGALSKLIPQDAAIAKLPAINLP